MSTHLTLHPSPGRTELLHLRAELDHLRSTLAERELQLTDLRSTLKAFEIRYLTQVGVLYAELDDLDARIAEREVSLYDSDAARARANQARRRAHETHEAAFGHTEPPIDIDPSPDLKKLFREVARRVHPDLVTDPSEHAFANLQMARANKAYARGDTEALQRLLDDLLETSATNPAIPAEDLAADLQRLHRQLHHARRDIAAIDEELATLPTNEIAQLKVDADAATLEGRDLLAELAANLRERIADASYRLQFLDRQLFAHGK